MSEFIESLQGWGIPTLVISIFVGIFLLLQLVGEISEACGKLVPEVMKIRKYFKRKKQEKSKRIQREIEIEDTLKTSTQLQEDVKSLLNEVNMHYSTDNIKMRNDWIRKVDEDRDWMHERATIYDRSVQDLVELTSVVKQLTTDVQLNNKMTSQMYKDSNRNRILDFAHDLINNSRKSEIVIYSQEEFNKIRRMYKDYMNFLKTYGGKNGQVDNAMIVVDKAERGEFSNIHIVTDVRDLHE